MENFQKSLFDLSQTPTTLDPGELEQRVQKYNAMLKEHVHSEPIDPILHQVIPYPRILSVVDALWCKHLNAMSS